MSSLCHFEHFECLQTFESLQESYSRTDHRGLKHFNRCGDKMNWEIISSNNLLILLGATIAQDYSVMVTYFVPLTTIHAISMSGHSCSLKSIVSLSVLRLNGDSIKILLGDILDACDGIYM